MRLVRSLVFALGLSLVPTAAFAVLESEPNDTARQADSTLKLGRGFYANEVLLGDVHSRSGLTAGTSFPADEIDLYRVPLVSSVRSVGVLAYAFWWTSDEMQKGGVSSERRILVIESSGGFAKTRTEFEARYGAVAYAKEIYDATTALTAVFNQVSTALLANPTNTYLLRDQNCLLVAMQTFDKLFEKDGLQVDNRAIVSELSAVSGNLCGRSVYWTQVYGAIQGFSVIASKWLEGRFYVRDAAGEREVRSLNLSKLPFFRVRSGAPNGLIGVSGAVVTEGQTMLSSPLRYSVQIYVRTTSP